VIIHFPTSEGKNNSGGTAGYQRRKQRDNSEFLRKQRGRASPVGFFSEWISMDKRFRQRSHFVAQ
jgi:hypothetical protein